MSGILSFLDFATKGPRYVSSNDPLPMASTATSPQGAATAGQAGTLEQAAVTTAEPTYTNGTTNPLSMTTRGGLRVDNIRGNTLATGQVAVPATPTAAVQVVAARAGRKSVVLTPLTSVAYTIGNTGVTVATGLFVAAGASVTIETTAAIFAVGASAVTLSYIENY